MQTCSSSDSPAIPHSLDVLGRLRKAFVSGSLAAYVQTNQPYCMEEIERQAERLFPPPRIRVPVRTVWETVEYGWHGDQLLAFEVGPGFSKVRYVPTHPLLMARIVGIYGQTEVVDLTDTTARWACSP